MEILEHLIGKNVVIHYEMNVLTGRLEKEKTLSRTFYYVDAYHQKSYINPYRILYISTNNEDINAII